ncbi:MAG: hypothetical protein QOK37_4714 [Thermoanaerobaculia bacterium]|jgi:hypothetical protein|nr:hypothetical protein [Thermoanaerobaculia bacterium]
MKSRIIATLFVLLAATSVMAADTTPSVDATLTQLVSAPDMFTFRGPVNVQYQLTIKNPLVNESITLRRITLHSQGKGAYSLRADDPISVVVNPDSSVTINLSAWARSNGGFMNQAPVQMVLLWFDRQNGKTFTKQFFQYLPQF